MPTIVAVVTPSAPPVARITSPRRRVAIGALVALVVGTALALVPLPAMARVPESGLSRLHPAMAEVGGIPAIAHRLLADPDVPGPARGVELGVEPFEMIGVQLPGPIRGEVRIRVHRDGGWTAWKDLHVDATLGPDGATTSGPAVTEPWWVGAADGYQLSLPGGAGTPEVLVVREEGHRWEPVRTEPTAASAPAKPPINDRASWGARPKAGTPVIADGIKLAVVHHTVSSNDYSPGQVPAMLRSIQAYHQDANGWSDIAYNFLVDRYGRIWEGNGGGMDLPVVGGHAKGFNTGSVGVAVLGDLTSQAPTAAAVDAVGRVIGWKLTISGVDPRGRVGFETYGNERFAEGTVVDLPRIVGHRDVGSTSCPGALLFSRLGDIRTIATQAYLTGSDPFGVVDAAVTHGPRSLRVEGWVVDPDASGPNEVHVYVDGVGAANVPAQGTRTDVLRLWPWIRWPQRVAIPLPALAPGSHEICAYAIDQGQGDTQRLGCLRATTPSGSPFGAFDSLYALGPSTFSMGGWAVDPDTGAPIEVHLYANGVGIANVPATGDRPDVADRYPGFGAGHGFRTTASVPVGSEVCAYAIDGAAPGGTTLLGCRTANRPTGSPFGRLDGYRRAGPGKVELTGWAIDPDATGPVEVHLYDETGPAPVGLVGLTASTTRPDLAAAYPGWGGDHGVSATVALPPGDRRVCAYAIDLVAPGSTSSLGCTTVPMPAGAPIGTVDLVAAGPRSVRVAGWTLDPDVTGSTAVHVYVDGVGAANVPADQPRSDVVRRWIGWDAERGFDTVITGLAPGPHDVCTFAIDANGSANTLLRCATVTVPTGPPIGVVDAATADPGGGLRVSGWGLDPDSDLPVDVHLYVDGVGVANVPAADPRPDVRSALPGWSAARGFTITTAPLNPGDHVACTFLIDRVGGQPNTLLSCRTVPIPAA